MKLNRVEWATGEGEREADRYRFQRGGFHYRVRSLQPLPGRCGPRSLARSPPLREALTLLARTNSSQMSCSRKGALETFSPTVVGDGGESGRRVGISFLHSCSNSHKLPAATSISIVRPHLERMRNHHAEPKSSTRRTTVTHGQQQIGAFGTQH